MNTSLLHRIVKTSRKSSGTINIVRQAQLFRHLVNKNWILLNFYISDQLLHLITSAQRWSPRYITYNGKSQQKFEDKTQCQLCKRLSWPIFPHFWSGLVLKIVSHMDVITKGKSTIIFLCIRLFLAWWHPTEWTTNQPGDPSASLLLTSVRRQSFAKRATTKF